MGDEKGLPGLGPEYEPLSFTCPNGSEDPVFVIRGGLKPGDIGDIVRVHGIVFGKELGFGHRFEAYVATPLSEFVLTGNPARERIWIAECGGGFAGCAALVRQTPGKACIRWLITEPIFRGRGLGKMLLKKAVNFGMERKYKSVFLWTLSDLTHAQNLFACCGFEKTAERPIVFLGHNRLEEKYEFHY